MLRFLVTSLLALTALAVVLQQLLRLGVVGIF
jgi:hypothetical protein